MKNNDRCVFDTEKGFKSPSLKIKTPSNRNESKDFLGVLFFTQDLQAASTFGCFGVVVSVAALADGFGVRRVRVDDLRELPRLGQAAIATEISPIKSPARGAAMVAPRISSGPRRREFHSSPGVPRANRRRFHGTR